MNLGYLSGPVCARSQEFAKRQMRPSKKEIIQARPFADEPIHCNRKESIYESNCQFW